ncbi:MAG: type II toxin-antitoxin system RelE/ParE family toxin [Magnetococcales bacterium]|nr:type II toxin-antitoxin system RelE/ParE family toxin [Magnetococcales bacterium]
MDHAIRKRILSAAHSLATNPRPPGSIKLEGHSNLWRIRAGDFRILYVIEDERLIILLVKVGHRREVYR